MRACIRIACLRSDACSKFLLVLSDGLLCIYILKSFQSSIDRYIKHLLF